MTEPGAFDEATILIVDDQEDNILLLSHLLRRRGWRRLATTTDPHAALPLFLRERPDLVLTDLHMPELDGFGVIAQLKPHIPADAYLPILVLTANTSTEVKQRALALGARDFLTKPFDTTEVYLRIRNLLETRKLHLQLQAHNALLEARVRERTRELEEAQVEIVERLAWAAEHRDNGTGQHARRVSRLSGHLARALGLPPARCALIERAAQMHDVGKVGIPDRVLLNQGKLDDGEIEAMRSHTLIGGQILAGGRSALIQLAERIALTHHERWDGAGYPRGLRGDEIPLAGRIVAVADFFDALTQARPYKPAWPLADTLAEIDRLRERAFDPEVVDALHAVISGEADAACHRTA